MALKTPINQVVYYCCSCGGLPGAGCWCCDRRRKFASARLKLIHCTGHNGAVISFFTRLGSRSSTAPTPHGVKCPDPSPSTPPPLQTSYESSCAHRQRTHTHTCNCRGSPPSPCLHTAPARMERCACQTITPIVSVIVLDFEGGFGGSSQEVRSLGREW